FESYCRSQARCCLVRRQPHTSPQIIATVVSVPYFPTVYLMYVDESGDTGIENSPTKHFALSSLIVHELRWEAVLQQLIGFRRRLRNKYGLKMAEEIHAAAMINKPGPLVRISRNDRLAILRAFVDEITHL